MEFCAEAMRVTVLVRFATGVRRAAVIFTVLALSACATRSPHYYGDDGPPDRVPAGLASTPDAVPRSEPLNPHANRPYAALGRTYMPDTSDAPFVQRGFASWYGRQFQGNRTASGEPYDMFAMTAAHPTLPIPSYARVTNVHDGRSVIVRINDRGPFLHDRIIDLSYAAATRLGIAGPGSGEVTVEKISAALAGRQIAAGSHAPAIAAPSAAVTSAAGRTAVAAAAASAVSMAPMGPVASAAPAPAPISDAAEHVAATGTVAGASWSVQLGAFAMPANAAALRDRIALLLAAPEADGLPAAARSPRVVQDGKLSRVLIGSLGDRAVAQAWAQQLERFLVRQTVLYAR